MKNGGGATSDPGSKDQAGGEISQLRPSLAISAGLVMIFVGLLVSSDKPMMTTVFISVGIGCFVNAALGRLKSGYRPPALTGWARSLNFGSVAVFVLLVLAFVSQSPGAAFGEYSTKTIIQLAMLANLWVIVLVQILCRKSNESAKPISAASSEKSTWDRELDG